MEPPIRILHLEDDPTDAELVQAIIESAELNCQITRVQDRDEFVNGLQSNGYDLILADFRLPSFDGISALRIVQEMRVELPFIFVSGTMGEDAAIEGLTEGATDYVLKQKMSRLPPAIKRALRDAENRRERKKAVDALRVSEERFRAVAESANEAIITTDRHGTIVYWNKAAGDIFGFAESEILGKHLSILMPEEHKRDYNMRLEEWGELGENSQIGRIIEATGRKKDGTPVPVEISVATWKSHDEGFFTGMVRDVSERKQAEARLHLQSSALEAAANGILITDCRGTILSANPGFTRLTGYTEEEVIGKTPNLLKSTKQDSVFYKNLWGTILSGQVWRGELVNKRKDGTLYSEEMTITPVRDPVGEISHFIAIKQDITERKQHENEREAIIAVANALRTAPTRSEMLPALLDQVNDLFRAEGTILIAPDPVANNVMVELGRGTIGVNFTGLHFPTEHSMSGRVITTGEPYLHNDVKHDELFAAPELLGEAQSVACAPLIAQEQIVGALAIMRQQPINENHLRLLVAIADIAANALYRATLYEQTEQRLHRLGALHRIDTTISSSLDLILSLNVLLDQVVAQLGVDATDVLLFNPDTQTLDYAAGRGFRTRTVEHSSLKPGEGQTGAATLRRQLVALPDLSHAQEKFTRGQLLAAEKFVSHFAAPLIAKGQIKGALEVFHRSRLDPSPEWIAFLETLATQAAIAIDNMTLFNNLQHSNLDLTLAYDATIEGWSRALDLRDRETEGHTQRVTNLTVQLAKTIGMSDTEIVQVRRGSLLHDIGKMGIPDSILLKPGPLTNEEWAIMRKHPVYAFELLSPIAYLRGALDIPHYHHEKWDGTGYPHGLKGEQIPLAARLFAIVDVWDALCSDRPYRRAWSLDRVREYVQEQIGLHFDPRLAQVFLSSLSYSK